jgi:hypothetical protein
MCYVDPLLGNDGKIGDYATAFGRLGSANRYERNISMTTVALQQRTGVLYAVRA